MSLNGDSGTEHICEINDDNGVGRMVEKYVYRVRRSREYISNGGGGEGTGKYRHWHNTAW